MAGTLRFSVEVSADQATRSLQALSTAFNQAGIQFRGSMAAMQQGAHGSGQAIGGLSGALQKFGMEQKNQMRMSHVFAMEIQEIAGRSFEAAGALAALGAGFAFGGAMGLAMEGFKVGIGLIRDFSKEADELGKRFTEWRLRAIESGTASRESLLKTQMAAAEVGIQLGTLDPALRKVRDAEIKGLHDVETAMLRVQAAQKRFAELKDAAARSSVGVSGFGKESVEAWKKANEAEEALTNAVREEEVVRRRVLDQNRLSSQELDREYKIRSNTLALAKAEAELQVGQLREYSTRAIDLLKDQVTERRLLLSLAQATTEMDRQAARIGLQLIAALRRLREEATQLGAEAGSAFASARGEQRKEVEHLEYYDRVQAAGDAKRIDKITDKTRNAVDAAEDLGRTFGGAFADMATGSKNAAQAFGAMASSIIGLVIRAAIAQIKADALAGAAAAFKSQAGVPIIGPMLGAAALAAALSLVEGLVSRIPSGRGGWWDTGAYEGLMVIHKREMVLPAEQAEAVRQGRGGVTLNANITAMDAVDVERVLTRHVGRMLKVQSRVARNRRTR